MTDRTLPVLMPTTDPELFSRTLTASVGINSPPPSQLYNGRATTFAALVPILQSHFFATSTRRRLIVVFTDGESSKLPPVFRYEIAKLPGMTTLFVHVWGRASAYSTTAAPIRTTAPTRRAATRSRRSRP